MPRYDFRCQDCDNVFEVRMSMSEYTADGKPECPQCGSGEVERSFTSVSVMTGSRSGSGSSAPPPPSCGHGGFT